MAALAFISNLAGPQGMIILAIIILVFGAKRLPELGKSLGETMREFTKHREKEEEEKKLPPKV